MITATLPWNARINIWLRGGQAQLPTLREAAVYLRLIEKVRPMDEERRTVSLEQTPTGFRWIPQPNGFGTRTFDFEDDEAAAIAQLLEAENSAMPFTALDAEWMLPLKAEIREKLPAKKD